MRKTCKKQPIKFTKAVFIVFILVFTVSIWNIVTSVFVEKALKLAEPDLDAIVVERLGSKQMPHKDKSLTKRQGKNSNSEFFVLFCGGGRNMMFTFVLFGSFDVSWNG